MKARVVVTERHTYEVDVDEALIMLARGELLEDLGCTGADITDVETVLVEISYHPERSK